MQEHLVPLYSALDSLACATDAGAARSAALAVKSALDGLERDDPDVSADVWLGEDQLTVLARAATTALVQSDLAVAGVILDAVPDGCGDICASREAVRALRANDPELALAVLSTAIPSYSGTSPSPVGVLRQRIAEATAHTLDQGEWRHRVLAQSAIEIVAESEDYEATFEQVRQRRTEWLRGRNLHDDSDLRAYVLATTCWARRDSNPAFVECATRNANPLAVCAPQLYDEIVVAARARLGQRAWSWRTWSLVTNAYVRARRDTELAELAAKLGKARPDRARMIARMVDDAADRFDLGPATPACIELPESCRHESLGTFDVESSVLTVGDPGYTDQCLRFHRLLLGALPGTWRAAVVRSAEHCVLLVAHHVDHPSALEDAIWCVEGSIDVEYGTAGVFDCAHYYDAKLSRELPVLRAGEHPWFDLCIARAHGLPGPHIDSAGVIPFGCVSASGPGDGSYTCYAVRAVAGIVAACIDYRVETEDDNQRQVE